MKKVKKSNQRVKIMSKNMTTGHMQAIVLNVRIY